MAGSLGARAQGRIQHTTQWGGAPSRVSKGAERVAEVAARFTLDAMPGKQMSIDAELRAGHIDHNEARRRRAALARESQLFGSMDGAMKFVIVPGLPISSL